MRPQPAFVRDMRYSNTADRFLLSSGWTAIFHAASLRLHRDMQCQWQGGGGYAISTRYNLSCHTSLSAPIHTQIAQKTEKHDNNATHFASLAVRPSLRTAVPPPQWLPQWRSISAIAGHRSRKRCATECQQQRVSRSVSIDVVDGQFLWAPHAGASGNSPAAQLPIGLQFF